MARLTTTRTRWRFQTIVIDVTGPVPRILTDPRPATLAMIVGL